jgi:hypothetical protein
MEFRTACISGKGVGRDETCFIVCSRNIPVIDPGGRVPLSNNMNLPDPV